jgi:hypothetical protein
MTDPSLPCLVRPTTIMAEVMRLLQRAASGLCVRAPSPSVMGSSLLLYVQSLSSTGRRNTVWSVTLKAGRDNRACLDEAAVVVEARPEGGPERR